MMQTPESVQAEGACLCGAVKYKVKGQLRPVVYCHCEQCRRTSGHFVAATAAAKDDLIIDSEDALVWYQSSDIARRGFCKVCGSSLFWSPEADAHVSIMAGSLNQPSNLHAIEHIFINNKGDYYELNDDLRKEGDGRQQTNLPENR